MGKTLVLSTSDGISDSTRHVGKTEGAQKLQGWDDTLGHLLSRDWAGAASWRPGQSDRSEVLRPWGLVGRGQTGRDPSAFQVEALVPSAWPRHPTPRLT